MKHNKYEEVELLIKSNINTLLVGTAGSGKSTLIMQAAENLGIEYVSITGTRQTTVGSLLGFISVTGTYIPTLLRDAVENGKLFNIDEIDGMDPNTLLCLNSLENGYLSFPDKLVDVHENFRLCATANPSDDHANYTGRSKLDASSLDRFDKVDIPRDDALEIHLTSEETFAQVQLMRKVLADNSMSYSISMRDSIRYEKRKAIGIAKGYEQVLMRSKELAVDYAAAERNSKPKAANKQENCTTIDELWQVILAEKDNK